MIKTILIVLIFILIVFIIDSMFFRMIGGLTCSGQGGGCEVLLGYPECCTISDDPLTCQEGICSSIESTNCVGSWSDCSTTCTEVYNVTSPLSGSGEECESSNGEIRSCSPGKDDCPGDTGQLSVTFLQDYDTISNLEDFKNEFKTYISSVLDVDEEDIQDINIESGSIIITFRVLNIQTAAATAILEENSSTFTFDGEEYTLHDVSSNNNCVGDWSECTSACKKEYTISVEQSGSGDACDTQAGDIQTCSPGEGACPLNTDCVGTWSPCLLDCSDSEYIISVNQSGSGSACEAQAGDIQTCSPGEGACPLNTDCVGTWGDCTGICGRIWTETTAQSGTGKECPTTFSPCQPGEDACPSNCEGEWSICSTTCTSVWIQTQAHHGTGSPCPNNIIECEPGLGHCPSNCSGISPPENGSLSGCTSEILHGSTCELACNNGYTLKGTQPSCNDGDLTNSVECIKDIDCVGTWSLCNNDCTKKYTISVNQSGSGSACEAQAGDIQTCSPGEDACPLNTDCVGTWSLCNNDCTKEYTISVEQSGSGSACEAQAGEIHSCEPGLGNCPSNCTISPPYNGSLYWCPEDVLSHGSTCELACNDGYTLVGEEPTPNSPFISCDDGNLINNVECIEDIDCVGDWSDCSTTCTEVFIITSPLSGSGNVCDFEHGNTRSCLAGKDDCPSNCSGISPPENGSLSECGSELQHGLSCNLACDEGYTRQGEQPSCNNGDLTNSVECIKDIDCVGNWSDCSTTCTEVFTITSPLSGSGEECEADDGEIQICLSGEGTCCSPGWTHNLNGCEQDIDCVGDWSECSTTCTKAYTISVEQSGSGVGCAHQVGDIQTCSPGEGGQWCVNPEDCAMVPMINKQTGMEGTSYGSEPIFSDEQRRVCYGSGPEHPPLHKKIRITDPFHSYLDGTYTYMDTGICDKEHSKEPELTIGKRENISQEMPRVDWQGNPLFNTPYFLPGEDVSLRELGVLCYEKDNDGTVLEFVPSLHVRSGWKGLTSWSPSYCSHFDHGGDSDSDCGRGMRTKLEVKPGANFTEKCGGQVRKECLSLADGCVGGIGGVWSLDEHGDPFTPLSTQHGRSPYPWPINYGKWPTTEQKEIRQRTFDEREKWDNNCSNGNQLMGDIQWDIILTRLPSQSKDNHYGLRRMSDGNPMSWNKRWVGGTREIAGESHKGPQATTISFSNKSDMDFTLYQYDTSTEHHLHLPPRPCNLPCFNNSNVDRKHWIAPSESDMEARHYGCISGGNYTEGHPCFEIDSFGDWGQKSEDEEQVASKKDRELASVGIPVAGWGYSSPIGGQLGSQNMPKLVSEAKAEDLCKLNCPADGSTAASSVCNCWSGPGNTASTNPKLRVEVID